ncbi:hypothetical protein PF010_g27123 [Phytophthora fragariae]|uniref:Uncharacterized protein n=1 Tax=Phytophthora fragariae TaxID=53985 RepID=A0A6A4CCK6_9STRA|nr:hypothetical protein PF010_g27123 [Phytophthora fragariae]KAE9081429.1 hypothetical protein PF006_g27115 [Phytophthora fragariae]KAE9202352.1 hypothetical protein PF004_g18445 [Phytophthora fragariae]KAE9203031.1 hypothetical protein PF002_g21053 [Phytophthora fragariae]KAE9289009.1 hypothetical protein PF001_g20250 [Phytophthora fragariae]
MIENFLSSAPAAAGRQQMLQLMEPILPGLLCQIDGEVLRLAVLIQADFVQSRKEHILMLAPFEEKIQNLAQGPSLLTAASLLIMESHCAYIAEHLDRILKNVVLTIVNRIKALIATPLEMKHKGDKSPRLEILVNFYCFFAGILWEQVNELLLDEEDLLQRIEKSFLEFDPESTSILKIPKLSLEEKYLDSDVARLVISARVPTLTSGAKHPTHFQLKAAQFAICVPISCTGESVYEFGFSKTPIGAFRIGSDLKEIKRTQRILNAAKYRRQHPVGGARTSNAVPPAPDAGLDHGISSEFKSVGEFELRFFYALTTQVATPLLKSISDVNELSRKMEKYVARHSNVAPSEMFLFKETTSEKREKLEKLVKRLDEASVGLQSTSMLG